jgi:hypothetical protein
LALRYAAYCAVFDTLYQLDPEVANVDSIDLVGLYELLLSADPTGMEGRPGSAGAAAALAKPK